MQNVVKATRTRSESPDVSQTAAVGLQVLSIVQKLRLGSRSARNSFHHWGGELLRPTACSPYRNMPESAGSRLLFSSLLFEVVNARSPRKAAPFQNLLHNRLLLVKRCASSTSASNCRQPVQFAISSSPAKFSAESQRRVGVADIVRWRFGAVITVRFRSVLCTSKAIASRGCIG